MNLDIVQPFLFWLRTSDGDICFDERVGTWATSREYARHVRNKTGETVFFYVKGAPEHTGFECAITEGE